MNHGFDFCKCGRKRMHAVHCKRCCEWYDSSAKWHKFKKVDVKKYQVALVVFDGEGKSVRCDYLLEGNFLAAEDAANAINLFSRNALRPASVPSRNLTMVRKKKRKSKKNGKGG